MTKRRRVESAFFVEANATVCFFEFWVGSFGPAALSHLLLKKSGCKIGVLRGHIDSSQFLEDVLAVDCNEHLCGCLVVVLRAGDGGDVSERLLYVVLGVLATTKINLTA